MKAFERHRWAVTPSGVAAVTQRPMFLAIFCAAALLEICNLLAKLPARANRDDFSIYYVSALFAHEGLNPYIADFRPLEHQLGLEISGIHHATDPPAFLLLMEPLASMNEGTAFAVWTAANVIFLGLTLILLLKDSGLNSKAFLLTIVLALLYPPVKVHFINGQSKILILLLLVLVMQFMERGWDRTAGLCLALAGMLRVFPLLLIGYLAIQHRWRMLIWTACGVAVGTVGTLVMFGLFNSLSFCKDGVSLLDAPYWLMEWGNISLRAGMSRLAWFCIGANAVEAREWIRKILISAADAMCFFATVWATFKLPAHEDPDYRAFTMWIIASVLLSPTAWMFDMVLFLIPFAQIVGAASRGRASTRSQWAAIASYLLIMRTSAIAVASSFAQIHLGIEWERVTADVLAEGWFVSAVLAFLAAYWFTIDTKIPADLGITFEKDQSDGLNTAVAVN